MIQAMSLVLHDLVLDYHIMFSGAHILEDLFEAPHFLELTTVFICNENTKAYYKQYS